MNMNPAETLYRLHGLLPLKDRQQDLSTAETELHRAILHSFITQGRPLNRIEISNMWGGSDCDVLLAHLRDKDLLVLAGGALTLAALSENCAGLKFCGTSAAQAAAVQTVELSVDGMTCASCKFTVKTVLKRLDGVQDVNVSYAEKKATVSYDPQRVTPEQMVKAINETGRYQSTLPPQQVN